MKKMTQLLSRPASVAAQLTALALLAALLELAAVTAKTYFANGVLNRMRRD